MEDNCLDCGTPFNKLQVAAKFWVNKDEWTCNNCDFTRRRKREAQEAAEEQMIAAAAYTSPHARR